jgi:hypothetical protein
MQDLGEIDFVIHGDFHTINYLNNILDVACPLEVYSIEKIEISVT